MATDPSGGFNRQYPFSRNAPALKPLLDRLILDAHLDGDRTQPAARIDVFFSEGFHRRLSYNSKL